MKKSFSDSVASLLKSLVGGSGNGDEDDIKKNEGGANGNDPAGNNDDDDIKKNKADPGEDGGNGNDDDDGGDDMSGEDVLKALDANLSDMRKSIEANQEQIQDLGGAIEGLAQMIYAIGNQQLPPKSVLNKSFGETAGANNGVGAQASIQKGRPTEDDLYRVQCILQRCVQDGTIDMIKSSMISSDMQKCMHTGQPMKDEYYKFLQKELAKEAK